MCGVWKRGWGYRCRGGILCYRIKCKGGRRGGLRVEFKFKYCVVFFKRYILCLFRFFIDSVFYFFLILIEG